MIMLHFGSKHHLDVALVSDNGATNTLSLCDTTFTAVSCYYRSPEISMLNYYVRKKQTPQD